MAVYVLNRVFCLGISNIYFICCLGFFSKDYCKNVCAYIINIYKYFTNHWIKHFAVTCKYTCKLFIHEQTCIILLQIKYRIRYVVCIYMYKLNAT